MGVLSTLRGRPRATTSVALGASIVFHIGVIALSARYLSTASTRDTPPAHILSLDIELSDARSAGDAPTLTMGGAAPSEVAPRPRPEPHASHAGRLREPRPDTRSDGKGGEREASERALHLSDSIDRITLNPDPTLFTEQSQVSRLDTAEERASREDRRTTPNPMELTFVSSGTAARLSRLVPARTDPAEGDRGAVPSEEGARPEPVRVADDGPLTPREVTVREGAARVAALGVDHGSLRDDYRRSAAVALARPSVRQGRASISTTSRGRPNDTVDSSQEVATAVQSLITASSAGGDRGRGRGGADAPGAEGSRGTSGFGSRSRPSGEGGFEDAAAALGIQSYAAALTRKVYPYWEDAFPVSARAEGRGGVAVIGVTLAENGSIQELHVVRGSGIPEFDQNVALALKRASPYGPLPRAVREGGLELNIAFDAMNPAVGREGPGPGKH